MGGLYRSSCGAGRQASAISKGEVQLSARRARGDFQRFIRNIEGKCFVLHIECGVGHSVLRRLELDLINRALARSFLG
jgi:hypothetical protein